MKRDASTLEGRLSYENVRVIGSYLEGIFPLIGIDPEVNIVGSIIPDDEDGQIPYFECSIQNEKDFEMYITQLNENIDCAQGLIYFSDEEFFNITLEKESAPVLTRCGISPFVFCRYFQPLIDYVETTQIVFDKDTQSIMHRRDWSATRFLIYDIVGGTCNVIKSLFRRKRI